MSIFEHSNSLGKPVSARLETAVRQIEFARRYTLSLLEDLEVAQWYWIPDCDTYTTHIAWQAGHIAMAQYGLTLFQQRGRGDNDSKLMSGKFRKLFMRATVAKPEPDLNPTPDEILGVLNNVQQQMLVEMPDFDGDGLDEKLGAPHAAYDTKLGAILFASHHEMVHAGQIGMLRRLMGKDPLR